ncbi:hypothetical protein QFC22_000397 [Naganishia vaughanmartiniae]|uniref:Uncharacterized protein n=1 Tax=Naganishia vaughanmartiniae TaxID=1424756 RepID=A0ACC2XP73_9TREE|nr:hypothetical protein QFC22_000397 [Naganishia vaughanmartiniae]
MSLPTLKRCATSGARTVTSRRLAIQARWNSTQTTPPPQEQASGSARAEQRAMTSIADIVGQPFGNSAAPRPAVPEYSTSLTDTTFLQTPTRPGYTVDNLPPKVDPTLELFAHLIMKHGKKAEAHKVVADVLQQLQVDANDGSAFRLIHRAIDMVSPSVRMVSLRRAAKNIPVPSALDARQRSRQGIQWILKAAERGRSGGQPRNGRLAREIMSVLEGTSAALQRKDEVHRLATVNRSNLQTR